MINPKKSNNLLENNKCFPWLPWTRQHWHRCICAKRNWCSSGCDIPVRPCSRCTSPTSNSTKTTRLSWSNGFQIFGKYHFSYTDRLHCACNSLSKHKYIFNVVYSITWAQFNHIHVDKHVQFLSLSLALFNDIHNATQKLP